MCSCVINVFDLLFLCVYEATVDVHLHIFLLPQLNLFLSIQFVHFVFCLNIQLDFFHIMLTEIPSLLTVKVELMA